MKKIIRKQHTMSVAQVYELCQHYKFLSGMSIGDTRFKIYCATVEYLERLLDKETDKYSDKEIQLNGRFYGLTKEARKCFFGDNYYE